MKISANYYSITPRRFIAGTKGSFGMEKLEIEFGEEWNGLAKRVIFYPPDSEPVGVMYTSEPIDIPIEVMGKRGKTKYAVVGYKDEKKLVTVSGEIDVLCALDDTEHESLMPTPDEMSQVMALMQDAVSAARAVRVDALNGAFDGRDGNRWYIGTEIWGESDSIERYVEGAAAGDLYLNTDSYAIYCALSEAVWQYVGTLEGGSGGGSGGGTIFGFEVDAETGMLSMTVSDDYPEGTAYSMEVSDNE